jgi:hypothetical protein
MRNGLFFVILAVIFHAIMLFPEVAYLPPDLNDNVFHYSLAQSLQDEIETGGNPIDHWAPYWSLGFPVFHHYQHFPHMAVAFFYNLFLRQIPLFFVFHFIAYLLLVLYPLALYFSLKKMKFSENVAWLAALFSLAVINQNSYGFELSAFTWRGFGMFSQLFAMFLFPLTLSFVRETVEEGKNYFWSVIFLFMLTGSQLMFGLMAILTSILFILSKIDRAVILEKAKRLAIVLVFFAASVAYLIVPTILDSPYHAHSPYDFQEKWDSYGMRYVITHFVSGDLLDYGRLPFLTVLTILGLFLSLRRREAIYRFAGTGFVMWLALYFGRPAWGKLIDLLPLSSALHLHRLIAMVHFFSIILAAIALAEIFDRVLKRWNVWAAVALIMLAALPIYYERFDYLRVNGDWARAYKKERQDISSVFQYVKQNEPGRVYAGLRANWGSNFKIGQAAVFYLLALEKIPAVSYLPFSWSLAGDFMVNLNESRPDHYDLFNIRYVLTDGTIKFPGFVKEQKVVGRFHLYRVKTSGYFDLVDSNVALSADKFTYWNPMLLWMRSSLPQKKQFVSLYFEGAAPAGYQQYIKAVDKWNYIKDGKALNILNAPDFLEESKYSAADNGKIISEEVGKNVSVARFAARRDCFLLFKMTYHPGWHAYVDGNEQKTVMLSPGLVGVRVGRGQHAVKFVYRAQWWKNWLLLAGIMAVAGLFFYERRIR